MGGQIMRTSKAALFGGMAIILVGCGTYVPAIQEGSGDDAAGAILVHAIVDSTHCEIRNAVTTVINNDKEAAPHNRGIRHAAFLDDWAAQVTLNLQIEEKTALNPTLFSNPMGFFTFGASGTLSADATRIDKLNYFYTVKDLLAMGLCPDFNEPHPVGSLLIQSDLKLAEWLFSQVINVGTGAIGVPTTPDTPLKQTVLSHEVKFDIVSTGNISPGWKLMRVAFNQTGSLLSGTRDRLHDLTIVFGPRDPTQKDTLAPTAQAVYLANQIGVSLASQIRSGLLP